MLKKLIEKTLGFIYARPRLRLIYWYLRAPFSPYAAFCFGEERVAREFLTDGQYRVLHGPYKGMFYTRHGSSVQMACLLGTYEMEIWPVIESVKSESYDLIVDVGSAEGYHACGLAKLTGKPVKAYDTLESARRDCAEMARLNGVSELVEIKSLLTHEELNELCGKNRVFVLCDIDFAETKLLDPNRVPALVHADLLVETHGYRPESPENTLPIILDRFRETHDVTVFPMKPRYCQAMWDFVEEGNSHHFGIGKVIDEPLAHAFFEARTLNDWVWLRSKSKPKP